MLEQLPDTVKLHTATNANSQVDSCVTLVHLFERRGGKVIREIFRKLSGAVALVVVSPSLGSSRLSC